MLPQKNGYQDSDQQPKKKSAARQVAGKAAKKAGRKVAKKALKAVAKKAAIGLAKGLAIVMKLIIGSLTVLGGPVILISIGIIVLLILLFSLSASFIGGGDFSDEKSDLDTELIEYVEEASQGTVDWDEEEQRPYRVPEALIMAAVQLEATKNDTEGLTDENKDLIDRMAEGLEPEFEYDDYEEKTKVKTETCDSSGECTATYSTDTHTIEKLSSVDTWETKSTINYEGAWSDYSQVSSKKEEGHSVSSDLKDTITKSEKYYRLTRQNQDREEDYTLFDNFLNEEGYEKRDKQTIEAIYSGTGAVIKYSEFMGFETPDHGGKYSKGVSAQGLIPNQFMKYYLDAEDRYDVDFFYIAAIHYVTTGFSETSTISIGGAKGPLGFPSNLWDLYGVDGNSDDEIEQEDLEDSIHSVGNFLKDRGFSEDKRKAIWEYGQKQDSFADKVMEKAEQFEASMVYQNGEWAPGSLGQGTFIWPASAPATSEWGNRFHPIHHTMRLHSGIDLAAGGTIPIFASSAGTVTRAYYSSSYGNVVFMTHNINGRHYTTLYAHMRSTPAVFAGQTVKQGQFLGNMGSTGDSTGQHLHFEIHEGNWNPSRSNSINPRKYLPKR